jgi:hypothetical protein
MAALAPLGYLDTLQSLRERRLPLDTLADGRLR